jgi:hypothetical protein
MRGALKPFQLLQSLGVSNYYQIRALLNVIDPCVMHLHT